MVCDLLCDFNCGCLVCFVRVVGLLELLIGLFLYAFVVWVALKYFEFGVFVTLACDFACCFKIGFRFTDVLSFGALDFFLDVYCLLLCVICWKRVFIDWYFFYCLFCSIVGALSLCNFDVRLFLLLVYVLVR